MGKVNFKKSWHTCTTQKTLEWQLVRVPTMNFVMVDGKGDPNTALITLTQLRRFMASAMP